MQFVSAEANKAPVKDLLETTAPDQRGTVKGVEIAKLGSVQKTLVGDYYIEITSFNKIDNGVEIFVKAWDKDDQQIGFGGDGTVEIERFVVKNPPILVFDRIDKKEIVHTSATSTDWIEIVETRLFKEDLREATLQSLSHTLSVKKQIHGPENIIPGKVGNTTLTAYPEAGTGTAPIDGYQRRSGVDEIFSTIVAGSGDSHEDTVNGQIGPPDDSCPNIATNGTTDHFQEVRRCGHGFDTSSIGSDNIDSATISLYVHTTYADLDNDDINVVDFTPADGSDFANSDFGNYGSTDYATGIAVNSLSTSDYNDWTLNTSGKNEINTSGDTFYGFRFQDDIDGSFDGTWVNWVGMSLLASFADAAGTSEDPKLVVEHSAAPVISNEAEGSITQTSTIITWNTDVSSDSKISYSTSTETNLCETVFCLEVKDFADVTSHSISLTGLDNSTTYYYVAVSSSTAGHIGTSTATKSFTTLASSVAFATRSTATTTNSNTTPLKDDELMLTLEANKTYVITGVIIASSTSPTPDLKIQFNVPPSASSNIVFTTDEDSGLFYDDEITDNVALPGDDVVIVMIDGTVSTGGTEGTLDFLWSQNTSNGNDIKIFEGSYLRREEVQ